MVVSKPYAAVHVFMCMCILLVCVYYRCKYVQFVQLCV
jgi:hypothetical protein